MDIRRKLRRKAGKAPVTEPRRPQAERTGAQAARQGPPRWKKAEKDIAALRERVAVLEDEVQECRRLNKRLAEITDVVSEVLLPAEQRDEDRLRRVLAEYDSTL